jgi:hypothetical protein
MIAQKVFDAVVELLATGQKISAYSLNNRAGLSRNTLQYHIKKKKQEIQSNQKGDVDGKK